MKYCNNCHRLTRGQPSYCEACGYSYDVRLCPRHHENPRSARVCSRCGSNDLSTPHPKLPFWIPILVYVVPLIPGLLLLLLSILLLNRLLEALLSNQQLLGTTFIAGLVIALLWWLYLQLPHNIRKAFGKAGHKQKDESHGSH